MFIVSPSQLFYGVGGILHDTFDHETLIENFSLCNFIIHQTGRIFQEGSVISLDFYRQ